MQAEHLTQHTVDLKRIIDKSKQFICTCELCKKKKN